jgi:Leucine-rich repeat (LRR) protein
LAGAWYRDFLGPFARAATRGAEGERTRLELGGAGLGRVPVEAGVLLSACVAHLALSRNRLGLLPSHLAGWGRLQALRLDFNRLAALPARFGADCEGLVELNLTGNRLAGLPESVSRLTGLATLLLSSNRLPALPPAIAGCTALTRLAARDNRLECVRAAGALPRLRALLVGHNAGLRHVAAEVGRCGALETLELDPPVAFPPPHVRAAGVAAALAHLRLVLGARETGALDMAGLGLARVARPVCREAGLTALDLSRNRLAALPPALAELAGLTRLVAAHNQVPKPRRATGEGAVGWRAETRWLASAGLESSRHRVAPPGTCIYRSGCWG